MLPLLLAGAGLSIWKGMQEEKAAKENAMLQADIAQYSPWTGMQAKLGAPKRQDLLGDAAQGALAGANFSQGLDSYNSDQALKAKLMEDMSADASANSIGTAQTPSAGGGQFKSMLGMDYSGMGNDPAMQARDVTPKGLYSSMSRGRAKTARGDYVPYRQLEDY